MNHTMIASKRHAASEQEHKLAKEVQKRAESIFSGGAERSEEAFHRARSTAQKSAEHSEDFFRRASCLAPDKLDPFRKARSVKKNYLPYCRMMPFLRLLECLPC